VGRVHFAAAGAPGLAYVDAEASTSIRDAEPPVVEAEASTSITNAEPPVIEAAFDAAQARKASTSIGTWRSSAGRE
jgi:hypothetical protein